MHTEKTTLALIFYLCPFCLKAISSISAIHEGKSSCLLPLLRRVQVLTSSSHCDLVVSSVQFGVLIRSRITGTKISLSSHGMAGRLIVAEKETCSKGGSVTL